MESLVTSKTQNFTSTTVINSALHYYNCRTDNIPLYLEPTNKTAT